MWTTPASDFVEVVNTPAENEDADQQDERDAELDQLRPFVWQLKGVGTYEHSHLPAVAHGFPDINADGFREVMIANQSHPSVLVFDGKTGKLLWHYVSTLPAGEARAYSGALRMPHNLGDIDGDGISDFATYFRRGEDVEQWLDAVSGKSGKRIWRKQLPKKLVGKTGYNLSAFCQIDKQGSFAASDNTNSTGRFLDRATCQDAWLKTVAAWPPMTISESKTGKNVLLLVAGSKLIICDAKTGQTTDFNQGQPLELGFAPAIEPKLVSSAKGSEPPIGVLLCEIVSIPEYKPRTKPVTRFSMRSLKTGEELWRYDSACDLNWTGIKPDWPLVTDLTGDAVPEILIADGADLENSVNINASRQSSLQALDARTGQPMWNAEDVAKIRCKDRQVQRLLMGPDADGDQVKDIYVVSPMISRDFDATGNSIYVDILSAADGKRIRTTRSEVPVFPKGFSGADLERPFFLGVGSNGHPRLVVATLRTQRSPSIRPSTVLISTGTGEVTNVGDGLEHPLRADGDGDGERDLFLIKPRSRSKIFEVGHLLSIKSNGGREQPFAKGQYMRTDDVDGDGVCDLLNQTTLKVTSGATGQQLWRWSFRLQKNQEDYRIKLIDGDADGDGIKDFLVAERARVDNERQILLTLVSGQTGSFVWQKRYRTGNTSFINDMCVHCEDMNDDGSNDLVLLHSHEYARQGGRRIECIDGRSGTEHWQKMLGRKRALYFSTTDPFFIADIDGNGRPDVLCQRDAVGGLKETVALDGHSGELLWEQATVAEESDAWTTFFGRSKLIPTIPNHPKQFVTAQNADKNIVRVDFRDIQNDKRVSSWSSKGTFEKYSFRSDFPPGNREGVPFAVHFDKGCYAGVCIQTKKPKRLQLVVLDPSTADAKVVQRIDIPKSKTFLIADINSDGRTDAIFHDGSDLVAIELASNKEINRQPMPAKSPDLSLVELDSLLFQLTSEGQANRDGEHNQLKLIDLKTFEVVWDLYSPPGAVVESLLSAGRPNVSNLYSTLPRVLYRGNPDFLRVAASEDDYKGDNEEVRQQISAIAAAPVSFSSTSFSDPRMTETLPWVKESQIQNESNEMIQAMPIASIIVLGAVIFPFFFIRKMITQKQWSLKTFLLLPLLFAIPYLVVQIPVATEGDFRLDGNDEWLSKLLGCCFLVLPIFAFITAWVKQFWHGHWTRLGLLTISPFMTAVLIGGMVLLGQKKLPAGSHYDWFDPGSLSLVVNSVYLIGLIIILTWFCMFVAGAFNGLMRRISGRSKLAAS